MANDDDAEYARRQRAGEAELRDDLSAVLSELEELKAQVAARTPRTQPAKIATSVRLDPDVHELWKQSGQSLEDLIRSGALASMAFGGSLPPSATPAEVEIIVRDEDGRVYKGKAFLKRA